MSPAEERTAFLAAIADNPHDEVVRKVYADWLDEHDEPEAADRYRAWTLAKHREAEEWLTKFATEVVDEDAVGVTVEQVMQVARDFVATSASVTLSGLGFSAENAMSDPETRERFWACYEAMECVRVDEELRNDEQQPFVCGC